jgi:CRISPR-associated protein Cas2
MAGNQAGRMLFVVAYDIASDRRRTRVHKVLSGFGRWTQYSVFECFVDAKELVLLHARLRQHLKPDEDSVRFYPLCMSCCAKVETVGGPLPDDPVTVIV